MSSNQIIPANLSLRWRAQSFLTIGWQIPNTEQNGAAVVLELTWNPSLAEVKEEACSEEK